MSCTALKSVTVKAMLISGAGFATRRSVETTIYEYLDSRLLQWIGWAKENIYQVQAPPRLN